MNNTLVKETNQKENIYGKKINYVYKTNNLTIFNNIDGNRILNVKHVKRICDSISVYGMKCNPILVNENMQVIDGQHRLQAAKNCKTFIYYIVIQGYNLNEVHTLNLNQKNWTKKDFMNGYAKTGINSYVKLKRFFKNNNDYTLSVCIAFCNNTTDNTHNRLGENLEVFENGTWIGRDFEIAQDWANKIRMIKPYYINYNRSGFVATMISLFNNEKFDFNEFIHKLTLQPIALVDCSNRTQYKTLIEDIYNYRSRKKVSLRY
jgi:hypothetical protein